MGRAQAIGVPLTRTPLDHESVEVLELPVAELDGGSPRVDRRRVRIVQLGYKNEKSQDFRLGFLVEDIGFEPMTYGLQSRRSPN